MEQVLGDDPVHDSGGKRIWLPTITQARRVAARPVFGEHPKDVEEARLLRSPKGEAQIDDRVLVVKVVAPQLGEGRSAPIYGDGERTRNPLPFHAPLHAGLGATYRIVDTRA